MKLIVADAKKDGYENKELCAKCKGVCCKKLSGCCYPEDFNITNKEECLKVLKELLSSGKYSVDWYEGYKNDYEGYFLRPAIKKHEGEYFHPSWGGECTFLTQNGCSLSFEQRPKECRLLKPNENFPRGCTIDDDANSKLVVADAWWKYRECFEIIRNEDY